VVAGKYELLGRKAGPPAHFVGPAQPHNWHNMKACYIHFTTAIIDTLLQAVGTYTHTTDRVPAQRFSALCKADLRVHPTGGAYFDYGYKVARRWPCIIKNCISVVPAARARARGDGSICRCAVGRAGALLIPVADCISVQGALLRPAITSHTGRAAPS
jgi:hypothetical protein